MAKTIELPEGVAVQGEMRPGYEKMSHPCGDRLPRRSSSANSAPSASGSSPAAPRSSTASMPAGSPISCPKPSRSATADWRVAPLPKDLLDRRIEITGPVDRKMVINALNCGANVFMADFEDANTPTWDNLIDGQVNLMRCGAPRRSRSTIPQTGRHYTLNAKTAMLLVRPRGWHLPEKHVLVDGEPMSGALFDFGLFFFHNAKELLARGTGPYFYLPKMESHLEARLWNDVFLASQAALGVPKGTIRRRC